MPPPLKIPLLILAAVAHRIAIKPPQPPPTKHDKVNKATHFEMAPRVFGGIIQILTIGLLITESTLLLALHFQAAPNSRVLSNVCANSSPSLSSLSNISTWFLLGIGMMYSSALLRLWCYKALGTFFTYEITIRRDHKLVTSGPYGFVRHPAYTGSVLMMVGSGVVSLCSNSYIDECNILSTPGRWLVFVWVALLGWAIMMLLGRGKIEDAGLRQEFGESWDRYRSSVPCKFIPGLV